MRISFFRRIIHILVPPVGAQHHDRYNNRLHHLLFDTVLSTLVLTLIGWNIVLLVTRPTPLPEGQLHLDTPTQATSGETISITLTFRNGDLPIDDAFLELHAPDDFLPEGTTRWTYERLLPEQTVSETVRGRIATSPEMTVALRGVAAASSTHGNFVLFGERELRVSAPLTLSMNAETDETTRTTTIRTALKNTGTATIENIAVALSYPAEFSVEQATPAPTIANGWTIATLAPNAEWTMESMGTSTSSSAQGSVTGTVTMRIGSLDVRQATASASFRILQPPQEIDNVQLTAQSFYTNDAGVIVGFGPYPPEAGKTTGFRIQLTLRHSGSLRSVRVRAILPKGVNWEDNDTVTAGDALDYRASDRSVTWTISNVTTTAQTVTAGFDITITPSQRDIGTKPQLLLAPTIRVTENNGTIVTRNGEGVSSPVAVKKEQ